MALSNMQVFDEYIMPATFTVLDQEIEKFNAASGGAILLTTDGMTGDFMRDSFFASLASARRRVDRYTANAAQAATPLTELQGVGVKVAGGFGPVSYEPSQMTWLERPTQQGVAVASQSFAQLLLQDQLNTVVGCLVAAIENNAALTNNVSGTSAVTYAAMNTAHAGFGDMSASLITDVMSGAMYHKLIGQNLANVERLFQAGNVRVVDMLGRRAVVTDAPALTVGGGTPLDKVLTLTAGAGTVSGANDIITNVETSNGQTRIETTFQADYSFTVALKGYAWDVANGGKSPDDAALLTGTNWNKVAEFDKMTAGVLTVGAA